MVDFCKAREYFFCVGETTTLCQVWPEIANGIVDIKDFCILTTATAAGPIKAVAK
jgi:hypothetical protein